MTDITRAQYVNLINTLRAYPSGRTPEVDTTDIDRAAGVGDGNVANTMVIDTPSNLPTAIQSEIDGFTDPNAQPIVGDDIRNLVQGKATDWSDVRVLRYELEGDTSPAGDQYQKYGYVITEQPGNPLTSSVPGTGDTIFDILNSGEDISLNDFNNMLATLSVLVNNDVDDEYPYTILYCHSQCHSQCHGSRGRR